MMLVIIQYQYGYDDWQGDMLFATPSRQRAEEKLIEFEAQQERQKLAEDEYLTWHNQDAWVKQYHNTPCDKRDYVAFDVRSGAKTKELEVKYNLRKKQLLGGHYSFSIEEVESD